MVARWPLDRLPRYAAERWLQPARHPGGGRHAPPARRTCRCRLTSLHSWFNGVAFTPSGTHVLFSSVVGGRNRLWTVPISGSGNPKPLDTPPDLSPQNPCFSRSGLACFTSRHERLTAYRGQVQQGMVHNRRLLASPDDESEWPAVHPTGESIAWAGIRAGKRAIFIGDRSGKKATQIGPVLSEPVRQLAWAPDRSHLAFTMTGERQSRIWLLDLANGKLRPLNNDSANEGCPSWSADGQWFYFHSNRGGTGRFYRMHWPQPSPPQPITPPAIDGREAPGGRSFLYLPNDQSRLMEAPLSGSVPLPVNGIHPLRMGFWTVQSNSIVYLNDYRGVNTQVYRFDWTTRKSQLWAAIPEWRPGLRPGIAASPDFSQVLWVYPQSIEKVYLLEGLAAL